ncbi:unnamed protein product [Gordionus sp. m RMFG-2023]
MFLMKLINTNRLLQKKVAGEMFNHVKKYFANIISKMNETLPKKTVSIYIAHDYNLVGLMNLLNVTCMAKPKGSSAVILELYRVSVSNYSISDISPMNTLPNNSSFPKIMLCHNPKNITYKLRIFYKAGSSDLTPLRRDATLDEL